MKSVLVGLVGLMLTVSNANATKHICVSFAIEKAKGGNGRNDTGYLLTMETSKYNLDLQRHAKKKVLQTYGGYSADVSCSNSDEADHYVIIETRVSNHNVFGVGFGYNSSNAEKNARKDLQSRNWTWTNRKHGYSISRKGTF